MVTSDLILTLKQARAVSGASVEKMMLDLANIVYMMWEQKMSCSHRRNAPQHIGVGGRSGRYYRLKPFLMGYFILSLQQICNFFTGTFTVHVAVIA